MTWLHDRHGLGNVKRPVAWPTDKRRPDETIREWVARLDVQENVRLGSVQP